MVLPNVIPQVFPHVLGPLPRLPLGCSCPLPSPQGIGLPHNVERGRRLAMSGQRLQARLRLSRLQSFTNVQARGFARRPGRSHRSVVVNEGRPRLLHPSRARLVTSSRIGYACRPNRAIDGRGLPPHETCGIVGCSSTLRRTSYLVSTQDSLPAGGRLRRAGLAPAGSLRKVSKNAYFIPFPLPQASPGATSGASPCRAARSTSETLLRYKSRSTMTSSA